MPIISNNPITVDGKTFDRFGVYLAVSPVFAKSDVGPSFCVRLVRYRKDENGNIEQHEGNDEAIAFSALTGSDESIEKIARDLMTVIQAMVNERGL